MNNLIYLLLYLWQLPQNIVALFLMIFDQNMKLLTSRKYTNCYIWTLNGGISLGSYAFVSKNLSKRECHVIHELDGHTKQSKLLGPLYLLIIGIPSILWLLVRRTNLKKYPNYYSFYTEKWANDCANIEAYKTDISLSGRPLYDLRKKE